VFFPILKFGVTPPRWLVKIVGVLCDTAKLFAQLKDNGRSAFSFLSRRVLNKHGLGNLIGSAASVYVTVRVLRKMSFGKHLLHDHDVCTNMVCAIGRILFMPSNRGRSPIKSELFGPSTTSY
jgi:hypothetical protein